VWRSPQPPPLGEESSRRALASKRKEASRRSGADHTPGSGLSIQSDPTRCRAPFPSMRIPYGHARYAIHRDPRNAGTERASRAASATQSLASQAENVKVGSGRAG
jgi:hypothetical protein